MRTNVTTWRALRQRYEAAALPMLSARTAVIWSRAAELFESICRPNALNELGEGTLAAFEIGLQAQGLGRNSIRIYTSRIRQAIKWGCDAGMLDATRFRLLATGPANRWPSRPFYGHPISE